MAHSHLRNAVHRLLRTDAGMKFKDAVRPVKHVLFGKQRIYKVLELVAESEGGADKVTTVFDVGAAIGEAALPMARAFPNATIHCFEPLPDSFRRLTERTKSFRDRIRYYNHGLYDREGSVSFQVFPHRDASTILPLTGDGVTTITIPVRRLDDVVAELKIPKIHFMKVDVEGVERQLFEGGRETLAHRVDNLFVEINTALLKGPRAHEHIDVLEQLYRAGFSFIGVWDDFFFSKVL